MWSYKATLEILKFMLWKWKTLTGLLECALKDHSTYSVGNGLIGPMVDEEDDIGYPCSKPS
jgi:hypothetical protein